MGRIREINKQEAGVHSPEKREIYTTKNDLLHGLNKGTGLLKKSLYLLIAAILSSTSACKKDDVDYYEADVSSNETWHVFASITYTYNGQEITDTIINETSNDMLKRHTGHGLANGNNDYIGRGIGFGMGELVSFLFSKDTVPFSEEALRALQNTSIISKEGWRFVDDQENHAVGYVSNGPHTGRSFEIKNIHVRPGDTMVTDTRKTTALVCNGPQLTGENIIFICKKISE